jgi:hypothetical protein
MKPDSAAPQCGRSESKAALRGAGGPQCAARAGGRVASEGRSTAASEQMRVMWSEQLEMIALGSDVPLVPKAPGEFLSIYFAFLH